MLTIVMYHYVRDLLRSRYPEIRGLHLDRFRQQLDYLAAYYEPVTVQHVLAAYREGAKLPRNAVLLTFDDGYLDHYLSVFPLLEERRIQGCFYPTASTVTDGRVLDVNKIHYILACAADRRALTDALLREVDRNRTGMGLESNEYYLQQYARPSRFDCAEVVFIKRMLQVALPQPLRSAIAGALFTQYVTSDERTFAAELYMSREQLRCMLRHGMYIGSHGYSHQWLDSCSPEEQEREIERSLQFLSDLGCSASNWVMCYPYGGYNDSLLQILRRKGCGLGLTTQTALAEEGSDPLLLPRLDTNDLPHDRHAAPGLWTSRVLSN